jgi:hypothetical protein
MLPPELPGGGELWQIDGNFFAVYYIPDTNIPLMYRFARTELVPPDMQAAPDKVLTSEEAQRVGAIEWGITSDLSAERGEHPWETFLSDVERRSQTDPWLTDPSALAWIADAWLRGEDPVVGASEWERSLTQDQRQWIMLQGRDPMTAGVRIDQTRQKVQDEVAKWLGPYYGNWSDSELDSWARKLASNYDQAIVQLEDHLRETRLAAFPEWTDPSTTYDQIARVGRQLFTQVWGESPDETDPLFLRVASGRDHVASMELLRREGWNRGVTQVVADAVGGLLSTTGGSVRRPM